MERGNNKFTKLNLNDIYGKKERKRQPQPQPQPQPPTRTTNTNTRGNHPAGYMLLLSRQKKPSLVAKDDEHKTISSSAPLKKENVGNPWAINPFVVCKEDPEKEKKQADPFVVCKEDREKEKQAEEKTKSKRETLIGSKTPGSQSNGLGIPQPGAAKIEGGLAAIPTYIPSRRPSPPREIRNWDDDERSTRLPLHQPNRGRYFGDDGNLPWTQKHSGGNNNVNFNRDYAVKGDNGDIDNNSGDSQRREPRYGSGMKQNSFHH